jgi:ABC-2 type transport system permease protein
MIKMFAIAKRILLQFIYDIRTLMLLFVAPVLVLWILSVLLGASGYVPTLATDNLPEEYVAALEKQDVVIVDVSSKKADEMLKNDEIDAILKLPEDSTTLQIQLEGSDRIANAAVLSSVADATEEYSEEARERMQTEIDSKKAEMEKKRDEIEAEIEEKKAEIEQKKAEAKRKMNNAKAKVKKQQKKAKAAKKKAKEQFAKMTAGLPEAQRKELEKQFNSMFASFDTGGSIDFPDFDMDDMSIDSIDFNTEDFDIDFNVDDYIAIQDVERTYLHGSDDWEVFDFFGPIFIGLFIFIFTFITSAMSLVNERSAGTMMRFLATPVKSWQILGGYAIAFALLSCAQVCVIVTAALKLIGFPNEGNVLHVVIIAVSLAIASVTFGLLVSGLAANAFQVVQLMLVFVVPQILLCGIFDLSGAPRWMQILSQVLPLKYGAEAMQEIMLRGSGLSIIGKNLAIIWGFTCIFFILASLGLRKKHARKV